MKIRSIVLLASCLLFTISSRAQTTETLHDFTAVTIDGNILDFSSLAGKRVLVVNTASLCAFTPQYAELQQLYTQYQNNSFEIIGFPSNDFFDQEPEDDSTINEFCTDTYGVTFQMMSKISVTDTSMPEIYKWLTQQSRNGVMDADVVWNFQKFMINESGGLIDTVSPGVSPLTAKITNWLDQPVVVGIESNKSDLALVDVFPNPSSGLLNVNVKVTNPSPVEIELYSVTGQLVDKVYSGQIDGEYQIAYDAGHLDKAMYFIRVETDNFSQVLKIAITE